MTRKTTRAGANNLKGERSDERLQNLRRDVDVLADRVDSMLQGEDWIQAKLYDIGVSLAALAYAEAPAAAGDESSSGAAAPVDPSYLASVHRVRETVRQVLPRDATVIVVSKGDERLLDLYGRRARHFPQDANGQYPWYYPADGPSVIAQLESLRIRGAQYLLFPEPAMWWLERYPLFSSHLHRHYPVVYQDDDTCVIFTLAEGYAEVDADSWQVRLPDLIADFAEERGSDPSILDWETGLELKDSFPAHAVFTPPDEGPALPYFDESVDIVVLPSPSKAALQEARRVAAYAVVSVGTEERAAAVGLSDQEAELDVAVERIGEPVARPEPPSVSIIIPTHNGVDQLRLCLASLDDTLPDDFVGEVIVVDDASDEEMQERLQEWRATRPHLKVVRNARNRGFVGTCNRGARAAKGEILVFLNDDTMPQVGWLGALLRTFRQHPDAGAVGGKLIYPDGRLQEAGNLVFSDGSAANVGRDDIVVEAPLYNYVREVDYCSAALLATPRALFMEIGGFDKRYEPGYYEDTDYCFEVRKHGRRVLYQPDSIVIHTEGATGGTDLTSGAKRFQVVNHGKFARKWKDALKAQPKRPAQLDVAALYGLTIKAAQR